MSGEELQCNACRHWQRRGGIVGPSAEVCTVLESERAGDRIVLLVTGLLRVASASNLCPGFERWPEHPDAYRSVDLGESDET